MSVSHWECTGERIHTFCIDAYAEDPQARLFRAVGRWIEDQADQGVEVYVMSVSVFSNDENVELTITYCGV